MSPARVRYGAAALSGALFALSFPPFGLRFLAWVALAPWFVVLLRDRAEGHRGPAFVFGAVFFGAGLSWLWKVHPLFPVGVSAFLALYPLLFAWLLRRTAPLGRGWMALVLPALWVGIDFLREHAFTGSPWLLPGHALARAENLRQAADLGGVPLLSFLVVLANTGAALVFVRTAGEGDPGFRQKVGTVLAALLLAATLSGYGAARRGSLVDREGPSVLLVQPSIPQGLKSEVRSDPDLAPRRILDSQFSLSLDGLRLHPDAELVVWAETMIPAELAERDPATGREDARTRALLDRVGDTVGVGTVPHRRFLGGALFRGKDERLRNAGLLLGPGGTPGRVRIEGRFDKAHLTPFGEYLPLVRRLPVRWTRAVERWVYSSFGFLPNLAAGDTAPVVLPTPRGPVRLGGLVCYEVVFPAEARRRVKEGADVLLNLSNYAWYGPGMHEQVLDITRFRAVECRRPVVVATNDGPTAVLDGNGEVRVSLPPGEKAALYARVPLDGRSSAYAGAGDLFAVLASLGAAAGVARGVLAARKTAAAAAV